MALQIPRQEQCETCRGTGAAEGSKPTTCPQCQGRGQLRYQQGFFTVARTCGQCRGTGTVIAKPCPTCKGAGRVQKERKLTVRIPPGIATGQRLRLTGEGEAGPAGGPAGRPLRRHPRAGARRSSSATATTSTARCRCRFRRWRSAARSGADARRQRAAARPGGHADRDDLPACAARACPTCRAAARRPAGDRQGVDAEEAHRRSSASCSRSWPRRCRREQSSRHGRNDEDDKGLFDRVKDIFG